MDVITTKTTADAVVNTLSNCRNEESFTQMWSHADVIAQKIRIGIEGTKCTFRDAKVPRTRPSRRLQALLVRQLLQRTTAHNRRLETTFVSQSITQVLTKSSVNFNQGLRAMTSRVCGHWAKSYSAVLQASTTSKLYQISMAWIGKCYQVRSQSLKTTCTTVGTHAREKNAAVMVKTMHQNGLHDILPVLYKVASILATIPATSCSAERSFSALRRIKTFLRSTMGQDRLSSIAVINIERKYANKTMHNDMQRIIDIFRSRSNCSSYFF